MSTVIAAIWNDAPAWANPGLIRYFDEDEWPEPGYEEIKRITDTTKAEMNAHERERARAR